jgi:broad specificity phosphatase PhoE
MELYLIRHGQSFNNTLTKPEGRLADPPLSEVGERQAKLVAEYLHSAPAKCEYGRESFEEGFGIDRLYCSAHLRCLHTATEIGETTGLAPEIWVDVHEEMGIWMEEEEEALPGLTPDQIGERFPKVKIPEDMAPDGWWNRPVEREEEWVARASRVAHLLRTEMAHRNERIAVVTHGGFTKDLLSALVNGGPMSGASFSTQNTSIARIDFDPSGLQIRYLNRVEHLPPELLT